MITISFSLGCVVVASSCNCGRVKARRKQYDLQGISTAGHIVFGLESRLFDHDFAEELFDEWYAWELCHINFVCSCFLD